MNESIFVTMSTLSSSMGSVVVVVAGGAVEELATGSLASGVARCSFNLGILARVGSWASSFLMSPHPVTGCGQPMLRRRLQSKQVWI